MDRKDKNRRPRPEMIWSERFQMWVDPDTRTPERRAKDEAIVRSLDADQERIQAAMREAKEAMDRQSAAIDQAAQRLALGFLEQLVTARKKLAISQSELARRMKVPPSAVVRLESGIHSPTLNTLSRYAAAIGVRLEVREPA